MTQPRTNDHHASQLPNDQFVTQKTKPPTRKSIVTAENPGPPTANIRCKFFFEGYCTEGERCRFSHSSSNAAPSPVPCKFFAEGFCMNGSRCAFSHQQIVEKKPKPPAPQYKPPQPINPVILLPTPPSSKEDSAAASSSASKPPQPSNGNGKSNLKRDGLGLVLYDSPGLTVIDDSPDDALYRSTEKPLYKHIAESNTSNFVPAGQVLPEPEPLCPFFKEGNCRFGSRCRYVHGEVCPICGKACLHPHMPHEAAQHMATCKEAPRLRSEESTIAQNIECGVCFEKIVQNNRRFGILSHCDHAFCLDCIREWRRNADLGNSTTVRSCPLCRTQSHFVIPSVHYVVDPVEKEKLVASYVTNKNHIPCKYFKYGDGECPFGSSCHYLHVYRDGTPAEYVIRKAVNDDGEVQCINSLKLGMFFPNLDGEPAPHGTQQEDEDNYDDDDEDYLPGGDDGPR